MPQPYDNFPCQNLQAVPIIYREKKKLNNFLKGYKIVPRVDLAFTQAEMRRKAGRMSSGLPAPAQGRYIHANIQPRSDSVI